MLEVQLNQLKSKVNDIILLGYGGSYSYGTNVEGSDIDLRGIALNPMDELIGIEQDFEQYIDSEYDSVVYSLKKVIKLLCDCNPNVIEMLGLRHEDYFILTDEGKLLLENKHLFLSKKAAYTFGGYAKSQLNRLVNRSGRSKKEISQNECRSISKALSGIKYRYNDINKSTFQVYLEDEQVYLNMDFVDMPIEKVINLMNEIAVIHKNYKKSSRNDKAVAHEKLNKHSMHLIRLYMMGIDLLKYGEINTYRVGADHDLLMAIRAGEYLEKDLVTPTKEFDELIADYEARFNEACETTKLPDNPDYKAINDLVMRINRMR